MVGGEQDRQNWTEGLTCDSQVHTLSPGVARLGAGPPPTRPSSSHLPVWGPASPDLWEAFSPAQGGS